MIWDNLIRARDNTKDGDADPEALVPSTWHLVRQRGMKTEVVAKGVGCYDVAADGSVVYTNGGAIYQVSAAGERTKVCAGQYIAHVIAI
jgi:glycine/D-amino acid oxidase-like deaminating enzyme